MDREVTGQHVAKNCIIWSCIRLVSSDKWCATGLGPALVILYVSDLDASLNDSAQKFAYNTKVFFDVHSMGKMTELQRDLDKLRT